jgi:hypothetical protein
MKNEPLRIVIDEKHLFRLLKNSIPLRRTFEKNYCISNALTAKLLVDELLRRETKTDRLPDKKHLRHIQNNVLWSALSAEKIEETLSNLN